MSDGYNLYAGIGATLTGVDFETPIATCGAGATISDVGYGWAPSTTYTLVLRPFNGDLETPDNSCHVTFTLDSAGEWTGLKPATPLGLKAVAGKGATVCLTWQYVQSDSHATPAAFDIWHNTTGDFSTPGDADETVTYKANTTSYSKTVTLTDATRYYFRVTARTSGDVYSNQSIVGPILTDSTGPTAPDCTVTATR